MVPMATSWPACSNVPVSVSLTISSLGWAYFFGKPQISRPAAIGGSSSRYIWQTKLTSSPCRRAGITRPDWLQRLGQAGADQVEIGLIGNDEEFAVDETIGSGGVARPGGRHRRKLE